MLATTKGIVQVTIELLCAKYVARYNTSRYYSRSVQSYTQRQGNYHSILYKFYMDPFVRLQHALLYKDLSNAIVIIVYDQKQHGRW